MPANATVNAIVETAVRGGASVASTAGNVSLLSAHNFDPDSNAFLTGKGATVSIDSVTAAGIASVADNNITAPANANITTEVGVNANISAAQGNVSVVSRSSNFAEARLKNAGGGLVDVSSNNPDAEVGGSTQARMLGNVKTADGGAGAH